jgi:hypothetical protein
MSKGTRRQQERGRKRKARIEAMRRDESALRDRLRGLSLRVKDFAAHAHYDALGKEAGATAAELTRKIVESGKEFVEIAARCYSANWVLGNECERLQRLLDAKAGRPKAKSPLELLSESKLEPKHKAALALLASLELSPDRREVEAALAGVAISEANAYLELQANRITSLNSALARLNLVLDEKVTRNWLSQAERDEGNAKMREFEGAPDRLLIEHRTMLDAAVRNHGDLLRRHAELLQKLAGE